jgi:AcrR family transcriptional regulator
MEHLSKHDEKAHAILNGAAKVFSAKGYHHASMRDIARETGMSLAGMYHYFSGKEEILFSIQRFCFRQVLDDVEARTAEVSDPLEKLSAVIHGHLHFFTQNVTEMRVLSHEAESLNGEYRQHIDEMKREYYRLVADILEEIHASDWNDAERRRNTLSIFGMINWIYTWYRPDRDGSPDELAATMMNILTQGIATPTKAG